MQIFHDETPHGKVTRAAYIGPDGSNMAASFFGWISADQVTQYLNNFRNAWAKSQGAK